MAHILFEPNPDSDTDSNSESISNCEVSAKNSMQERRCSICMKADTNLLFLFLANESENVLFSKVGKPQGSPIQRKNNILVHLLLRQDCDTSSIPPVIGDWESLSTNNNENTNICATSSEDDSKPTRLLMCRACNPQFSKLLAFQEQAVSAQRALSRVAKGEDVNLFLPRHKPALMYASIRSPQPGGATESIIMYRRYPLS